VRSPLGLLALLQGALLPAASAQTAAPAPRSPWSFAASIGTSTFNGATAGVGDAGETLEFAPYRPTMVGISITYGREQLRIALAARHGDAGIGFRGVPLTDEGETLQGLLIIAEGAYSITSVATSASVRLARLRDGPALRSSLGLTMERWTAPGTPARMILGAQAGLALEIPLSRAFAATLEGELGFTPKSPFQLEDLPEGFRERSTWRRTLMAGVSWRP
jgi:hypothetical protein